ncbi:hypothetical protein EAO71_37425 [Streptomyces sp. ms191]|uniref:SAV_2336 N-terminal domain-related protein n=1 Tax=Streptomyces sp. ms191 TaxID=1827978 RepID=UPI001312C04D|nr:SAV_2336 N-terminal domain-related protein [Streptomyces sp. ms191]TXS08174.1 hypothetical protein EAO71_37425 [Streptomyces sp. ms191]
MLPLDRVLQALDGEALDAVGLADALWLAARLPPPTEPEDEGPGEVGGSVSADVPPLALHDLAEGTGPVVLPERPPDVVSDPRLDLYLPGSRRRTGDQDGAVTALRLRAPRALPNPQRLVRALRPLTRRVPSRSETELDEEATVQSIVDTALWSPVLSPAPSRWLDMALVVDDSISMTVWQETVRDFLSVLVGVGAFRSVLHWKLPTEEIPSRGVVLRAPGHEAGTSADRSPLEIIDPTGRRVVLVVSDCISPAWSDGTLARLLHTWGQTGPIALVQVLPRHMWERSALGVRAARLQSPAPGAPNTRLACTFLGRSPEPTAAGMPVPVLEMDPRWLGPWASLTSGEAPPWDTMVAVVQDRVSSESGVTVRPIREEAVDGALSAKDRVNKVAKYISPAAFRLACHLAVVPLSFPVMRLVQRAICRDSRPSLLTEVLFTGLITRVRDDGTEQPPSPRPDVTHDARREVLFDFRPEVRAELLTRLRGTEALQTLTLVSDYALATLTRSGEATVDFTALVEGEDAAVAVARSDRHFATVTAQVLRRLGPAYEPLARRLEEGQPAAADRSAYAVDAAARTVTGEMPEPIALVGRSRVLGELRGATEHPPVEDRVTRLAIVAREGGGSTAVAAAYVAEHYGSYRDVLWLNAGREAPMGVELPALVRAVGQARAAGDHAPWLLVLDDARPQDVPEVLPQGPGTLVVTSTVDAWPADFVTNRLSAMRSSASLNLLRDLVPSLSSPVALRIAARLGHLPLAVTIASGLLTGDGDADSAGAGLLVSLGVDASLEAPPSAPLPDPLAALCELAFERVVHECPETASVLDLLTVLGPGTVPLSLLRHALPGVGNEPGPAVDLLTRSDLIQPSLDGTGVSIRPAVRRAWHQHMDVSSGASARRRARAAFVACVSSTRHTSGETAPKDARSRHDRDALTRHLVPMGVLTDRDPALRDAVRGQVHHLALRGDPEGARMLAEQALAAWGADEALVGELSSLPDPDRRGPGTPAADDVHEDEGRHDL